MTIKEKPFFDAIFRIEPLPKFLFSNPIFAGFFCIIMCAIFGAVGVLFVAAAYGTGDALELFELARWGAVVTVIFGAVILLGVAVSALFQWDEAKTRLLFVFGGVLGIALLAVVDRIALEALRGWLAPVGRIL